MNSNNLYFYVLLLMLLGRSDGSGNTCVSDNCLMTLLLVSLLGGCGSLNGRDCGCGCGCGT